MSDMKICSFEGCGRRWFSRDLCRTHYDQALKGVELRPLRGKAQTGSNVETRLLTKLNKTDTCWNWTGGTINGYGSLTILGKTNTAHRWAYETWVGEIPVGSLVHHKCANRLCSNPDHLQLTTHHDNMAEMFARKGYEARIAELEAEVAALKAKYE